MRSKLPRTPRAGAPSLMDGGRRALLGRGVARRGNRPRGCSSLRCKGASPEDPRRGPALPALLEREAAAIEVAHGGIELVARVLAARYRRPRRGGHGQSHCQEREDQDRGEASVRRHSLSLSLSLSGASLSPSLSLSLSFNDLAGRDYLRRHPRMEAPVSPPTRSRGSEVAVHQRLGDLTRDLLRQLEVRPTTGEDAVAAPACGVVDDVVHTLAVSALRDAPAGEDVLGRRAEGRLVDLAYGVRTRAELRRFQRRVVDDHDQPIRAVDRRAVQLTRRPLGLRRLGPLRTGGYHGGETRRRGRVLAELDVGRGGRGIGFGLRDALGRLVAGGGGVAGIRGGGRVAIIAPGSQKRAGSGSEHQAGNESDRDQKSRPTASPRRGRGSHCGRSRGRVVGADLGRDLTVGAALRGGAGGHAALGDSDVGSPCRRERGSAEVAGRRVSVVGVLRHRAGDHGVEAFSESGVDRLERRRRAGAVAEHLLHAVAFEGHPRGEHLK